MSAPRPLPIVRDEFQIGYTAQREWSWLIAIAFFLGKVGAGLFAVSYFAEFDLGALVGLVIVGVGKSAAHMLFLGRPERFLRAVVHWRTSRLSQGLIAMGVFIVAGLVYLGPYFTGGEGDAGNGGVWQAFGIVALVAAIVLMVYDGFVLIASRGIALWRSPLLPLLAAAYSLLGGTTATLVLWTIADEPAQEAVEWLQIALLAANLVLVAVYVLSVQVRSAAAQFAVSMLTRGPLGYLFLVVAIGLGLVATLALAAVYAVTDSTGVLALAAVTDLLGHFVIFFAILLAGIFAPIRSPRLRPVSAAV